MPTFCHFALHCYIQLPIGCLISICFTYYTAAIQSLISAAESGDGAPTEDGIIFLLNWVMEKQWASSRWAHVYW
jgi:hypothetical protein